MDYKEFIDKKKHISLDYGFEPSYFPDNMFDFQKHIVEKACKKGRIAIFADTGLGKTMIALTISKNINIEKNGRVLIVTPLAVAFQFLEEAKKIGIDDISYSRDGKANAKIVVCNYEMLNKFECNDFDGIILDESSILKNFKGKIKTDITAFMRKIKYRFLMTATPSPNDFIELGTSAEALGYMGYMDMLGMFFKNNQNSVDSNAKNIGEKYYLKPHAEESFFQWVSTWAIMVRKPSDLGFSDDRYKLPKLIKNIHVIKSGSTIGEDGTPRLFIQEAKTMSQIRNEQKLTAYERCEKAYELADGKTSVYWVNTNDESNIINKLDSDAVEILGSQSVEKKEEILLAFARGEIKRLITKAKITGMGLNWQHCNHSVFFPTFSYEQYYQAIRRFWRFGQKNDVIIDIVISEGQRRVIDAIEQKSKKADELYTKLVNGVAKEVEKNESKKNIIIPNFI